MNEEERYFVCPRCYDLKTWTDILEECSSGGQGLCDCRFSGLEWSEEYSSYEPVYFREYTDYVEITKRLFDALGKVSQVNRILHCIIPGNEMIESDKYDILDGVIDSI